MGAFSSKYTTAFLLGVLVVVSIYELPSTHTNLSKFDSKLLFKSIGVIDKLSYSKKDIEEELRREYMIIQDRAENNTHTNKMAIITPALNKTEIKEMVGMNHNGLNEKGNTVALKPAVGGKRLCLIGKPYGYINEKNPGWSNFILAVHHARRIVAKQHGFVVIHAPHHKRFQQLFGPAEDVIFVKKWGKCNNKMTYKKAFYYFPFASYTHFQVYKPVLVEKAKKAMKLYRRLASGKTIVSVHRRWFIESGKTQCKFRMRKCPQFCSGCGDIEFSQRAKGKFEYACYYTEESVRKRFENFIPKDAYIILFTDGQEKSYDSKFTNKDTNHFHVQQVMMSMTDIHIGNPASSVDKLIGAWRWVAKKLTLPRDCYRYDHKHNAKRTAR